MENHGLAVAGNRGAIPRNRMLGAGILVAAALLLESYPALSHPHQANGIKIGEVDSTSAVVWTRLTKNEEPNWAGVPFPLTKRERDENDPSVYRFDGPEIPEGLTLEEMKGAVPGAEGEISLHYWPEDRPDQAVRTEWARVSPDRDFTLSLRLAGLAPDTSYHLVSIGRAIDGATGESRVKGAFKTAPAPDQAARVVFTAVTGQEYHRRDHDAYGHRIYPVMSQLDPDFFVHTGDIVYFDKAGPNVRDEALARLKWNRMYGLVYQRDFHNRTPSYFIKDDHETWQNDCWPTLKNNLMGSLTFRRGQEIFLEQVPMSEKTYRTVRWGKDLQIWMVEGRDFRSPNDMPDGPGKTIWGAEQMEWFERTVRESDVAFRVLISPTPIVGPDRSNKSDNHANKAFTHEGDRIRKFIAGQKNLVVVCGDRHWQYASVDEETGVREYCTGPTSELHAGGFSEEQRSSMHRYLNICGGFLSGTVDRADGAPTLTFRHHSVSGEVLFEDRIAGE